MSKQTFTFPFSYYEFNTIMYEPILNQFLLSDKELHD